MAPVFVNWQSAAGGFGPDDFYILRNVNIVNNPVGGIVVLGGLKVFADSVETAEFVTVTWKAAGRDTDFGHGMLRFIFRKDRRPIIIDREGNPFANDAAVEDIVVSWEAWRPPKEHFDPLRGLDPTTYALTPRCMLGTVRCLTDTILDRPWTCYPLKFPEVEHAYDELLFVSLALADSVARQTVANLLDRRIDKDRLPDDYPEPDLNEWEYMADHCRTCSVPENPILDILQGKLEYQLLERSCVTMALASVDWASHRIHQRAGLVEAKRLELAPTSMPSFLADMAVGERIKMLLRIPAALYWLVRNHSALAGKAPDILNDAGLLQHTRFGRVKKMRYGNRRKSAYGELLDHVIY
jgi:hypothetical protein